MRGLIATLLVFFGTSAFPFSDGFEARASECYSHIKTVKVVNAVPVQPAVIVQPGTFVCVDNPQGALNYTCRLKADGKTCETVAAPIPPNPPEIPLPAGFTYFTDGQNKPLTWEKVFYGATFPNSPSYMAPVGSYTGRTRDRLPGKPVTGKVLAVPVTMTSGPVTLAAVGSQSIPAVGYSVMPANATTIAISRTKGDIAIQRGVKCSVRLRDPRITFGPNVALKECRFNEGEKLWIHFTFQNVDAPLDPTKNSCAGNNTTNLTHCDRNFKTQ